MHDVLAEVLDAISLRCVRTQRIRVAEPFTAARASAREVACYVVLEGRLHSAVEGRELTLLRSDALLVLGREAPLMRPDAEANSTLLCCSYRLELDDQHPLLTLPPVLSIAASSITDESELGQVASLLDAELLNHRDGAALVTKRLADVLFVEALRRYQLQAPRAPFLAALADGAVSVALAAIHREPARGWQLDELAALAGLSRGVFAERFHQLAAEPPLRYLRGWRMLRARKELREGERVSLVSARAGYRSTSGFRRAFRHAFGCAPTEVRP